MEAKVVSKDNRVADSSPSNESPALPKQRRVFKKFFAAGVLVCFALLVLGVYALRPCQIDRDLFFTVSSGQSLAAVARTLHRDGLIADPFAFRVLARWHGQGRKIQAGSYRFAAGRYQPGSVLQILVEGRVELVQCTLPEGMTALEVAHRCSAAGIGQLERYRALFSDRDFLNALGVDALEGYLFPETYRFAPGVSESSVLTTMVTEMRRHLNKSLLTAAAKQGLNELQLLTLASIIQKEAGNVEEMPLISAVFHNRLKRGMLLQADPTVIYGLGEFDGNLTRIHLRTPTPYNTYVHRGLPPGPIANPGLDALTAAAHPADENYLYFVATGDGVHYFSKTLKEHNRAVRRYQLRR
nr:endolytic transglycosylase MltG [Desulfuromonas acetoxidans]